MVPVVLIVVVAIPEQTTTAAVVEMAKSLKASEESAGSSK
jgi:hypothetical protein